MYVSSTGFGGHENWIWKHRRAESCHSAGAGESILTSWRAERHISNGFRSPTTGEYCDNHNVDLCDRERWEAATPSCAAPAVKLSAGWRKLSANRGSLQRWHSLASTSKILFTVHVRKTVVFKLITTVLIILHVPVKRYSGRASGTTCVLWQVEVSA